MTMLVRWSRIQRLVRSVSLTTVDQGMSALSNLFVTLAVARAGGMEGLGRFAFAFAAYLAVLGTARSLISQPLLAQPVVDGDREAERASTTLTLLAAVIGAVVVGAAGLALGRSEMLVVAVGLPLTMIQDVLRYHAFRRQQPRLAVLLDGGWAIASLAAWPVIVASGSSDVAVLCWSGAALAGIAMAWRGLRPGVTAPRAALAWWRRSARELALPLLADSLLVIVSAQAVVFLLAATAGDGALGLLRAAQVYFGPLSLVLTALGVFFVPRLAQRATRPTPRLAVLLATTMAAVASVACIAIILGEPVLHVLLYAGSITVPLMLLIPIAVQTVLTAGAGGFTMVAMVDRRAVSIPLSRISSSVLGLAVIGLATVNFGVEGAAWALAIQSVVYLVDLGIRVTRRRGRAAESGGKDRNACV